MDISSQNIREANKNEGCKVNDINKTDVEKAARVFINDGKKLANEIYNDGLNRINVAEVQVKEYSDEVLKKIQRNPLASVLIAGGVGFLLSMILRK